MKKLIICITIMLTVAQIYSQSANSIISQIKRNNSTLKVLTKNITADSVGNRTDIYLQNPEIEFNYLSGSPAVIGNRKEFNVMQTFDFPTVYLHKSKIANLKNEQLAYSYLQQSNDIVLQTKLLCVDLIYYNLLIKEYKKRYGNAEKIAQSYKTKFEIGEANILEHNKAELNKLNTAKTIEKLEIEKNALLNELIGLNGNIPLTFEDTVFFENQIPAEFEQWYAETEKLNPVLNWLKLETELSVKQQKMNTAQSFPKFKAGYMSEFTVGENFQGISMGISVPLWENKNKIKYAKLKSDAAGNYENASKQQTYNLLKSLHTKAVALQKSVNEYKANLQTFNNSELLYRAFEKGEIDLINYIMELSFYYESYSNLLDMERELHKVLAQMYRY